MLVFYVGGDRYALPTDRVVEVVPRAILREVHRAPDYIAGLLNYRGEIVPVIDLCKTICGKPTANAYSSRIITIENPTGETDPPFLGLMAERVTDTFPYTETERSAPCPVREAPYLGATILDEEGMIQIVRVEFLWSSQAHAALVPSENEEEKSDGVSGLFN